MIDGEGASRSYEIPHQTTQATSFLNGAGWGQLRDLRPFSENLTARYHVRLPSHLVLPESTLALDFGQQLCSFGRRIKQLCAASAFENLFATIRSRIDKQTHDAADRILGAAETGVGYPFAAQTGKGP